jgi:type II secretory pathway pseudopilin PulG
MKTLQRDRRHRQPRADGGFVLLESIIAIALITIIMTALTALFVTSIKVTDHQRASQNAIRIATDLVDQARALGPEPADTSDGLPSVDTALLPASQSINGVVFTIAYDQSWCRLPDGATGGDPVCADTDSNPGALGLYLRLGVTLSWPGADCPAAGCTYRTSVVMNTDSDPYFPDPTPAVSTTEPPVETTTTPPVSTSTSPPPDPGPDPIKVVIQNQTIPKSTGNCKGDSIKTFSILTAPNSVTGGSAPANLAYSISSNLSTVTMSGSVITIVAPCHAETYAATVTVTDTSATNPSPSGAASFSIAVTNN